MPLYDVSIVVLCKDLQREMHGTMNGYVYAEFQSYEQVIGQMYRMLDGGTAGITLKVVIMQELSLIWTETFSWLWECDGRAMYEELIFFQSLGNFKKGFQGLSSAVGPLVEISFDVWAFKEPHPPNSKNTWIVYDCYWRDSIAIVSCVFKIIARFC